MAALKKKKDGEKSSTNRTNNIGDLLLGRYGSVGIIRDYYFHNTMKRYYYEVEWFKLSERDKGFNYSVYFADHEVERMEKRMKRYQKLIKIT